MKHHFWKENGDKILTGLLIAAGAILIYFVFMKMGSLWGSVKHLVQIIAPIVSGAVIAYLVAPICNAYERGLYTGIKRLKMFRKDKTRQRVSNALAVAGSMLTLIAPDRAVSGDDSAAAVAEFGVDVRLHFDVYG